MAEKLPRLRMNLEFQPSPFRDRPGLLIRDSQGYSDTHVIVPPALVGCLQLLDGYGTDLDLRQELVRLTGSLEVGEIGRHFLESLSQAGLLEDETYARMRDAKHRAFAESPVRPAVHAGSAYPGEADALRDGLAEILNHEPAPAPRQDLVGIAAPHVSIEGGRACYRSAYRLLSPELADRTFVVLGTSHHGAPDRFGLTRKPFSTPLGETVTAAGLVDELIEKAAAALDPEDYCHSIEHSIEFQVLFLQHLFGPAVRLLPILCGAYVRSFTEGGKPEADPAVDAFLAALREIAEREGERLFWVLGVDLAHVGRRYGDPVPAAAARGAMLDVAKRDRSRLELAVSGDADGFWESVCRNRDPLHWCGSSAIYTFLKALPGARGEVEHYDQWNIDEESVVSFAALSFSSGRRPAPPPSSSPAGPGL